MSEQEKVLLENEKAGAEELDLNAVVKVTGGALKDVQYTATVDISEDTKNKV
jgi:hypothetical protein